MKLKREAKRKPTTKRKAPATIDAYLSGVDPEKREALEKLRRDIHAAAPGVEECISYGVPAFRHEGRMLVWFAAASRHCSFFPGAVVEEFVKELSGYQTRKGTVRFAPARPLAAGLVRKLVRARIARNARSSRSPPSAPGGKNA